MLHHLLELAGPGSEPGFAAKEIRWQVELSKDGRLLGVLPLGEGKRGELHKKCPDMHNMNAGGRAHFLVETAQTVALYLKEGEDAMKIAGIEEKQRFFIRLVSDAAQRASSLSPLAVFLGYSESVAELRKAFEEKKARPQDWVKFCVDGADPLQDPETLDWWRGWRRNDLEPPDTEKHKDKQQPQAEGMVCLLTGEIFNPAETHPKITGLGAVGGIPTGDVMSGFDKDALRSYGLDKSLNAATSEATARAYADALNDLIRNDGVRLANTLVVHWFKEKLANPREDDAFAWLIEPPEQQEAAAQRRARALLSAIRNGERPDLGENRYFALTISGAAGRVMVRDWMEGAFEDLLVNITAWFDDFSIVVRDGGRLAPEPKLLAVGGALVRDLKDLPAPMLTQLWRCAIGRKSLPFSALAQALARVRVDVINDDPMNHARMGLIKAYFIRKGGNHGMSAYLNSDHPDPAYHCGRLIAVLANLQRAALGDVGAGVVQRYYTACSQTPALVIGRLMSNAKNHLGKLEGGLAYWYENKIADILSRIEDRAPRTLDLECQSLFALGYYQQLASDRVRKSNQSESTNDQGA
jgi:CRISPR-associated protein Csd1